ncbi:MAG: hypothetical protein M3Y08_19780 [Fibrobacterota bacterium]|nr:hypothetical protein [Fibrobacterota bacterium]
MSTFNSAFHKLMVWEGGYSNDPADPGGPTQYGITQRALDAFRHQWPETDMPTQVKNLTKPLAATWYMVEYWAPLKLTQVNHQELASAIFSFAVNQGAHTAVKRLQRLLGVKTDGQIGPKTLEAINKTDGVKLCNQFCAETARFYRGLIAARPSLARFEHGWLNRVSSYTIPERTA